MDIPEPESEPESESAPVPAAAAEAEDGVPRRCGIGGGRVATVATGRGRYATAGGFAQEPVHVFGHSPASGRPTLRR